MLAHLVHELETIFLLNIVLRVFILLLTHEPGTVPFDPIKPISNLKLAPFQTRKLRHFEDLRMLHHI
jgi:hypothetical protein